MRRRAEVPELARKRVAEGKLAELGEKVIKDISRARPPKLKIPSRSTSNIIYDEINRYFVLGPRHGLRSAGSVREVKKFAQLMCAADFSKELIEKGKFATLREMYYTAEGWEVGPFRDQGESDMVVEDLEAIFGLKREDLGLTPEEDGAAVYGELVVEEDGVAIDATKAGRAGYTIPPTIDDVKFVDCGAERIVAVETMGMYHRLVQEKVWREFDALVVGLKGQAARATRRFLRRAHDELKLPVYLFCMHGDEPMFVIKDGLIREVKIKDLVEDWPAFKGGYAISVSKEGKVELKPLVNAIKRDHNGEMYEIFLEGGYSVRVTDDHPMLALNGNRFAFKLAHEVKMGDLVPVCLKVPNSGSTIELDMVNEMSKVCPELLKKIRIEGNNIRWKKSSLKCPIKIPVTQEFCRLLGYFVAEGCITRGYVVLSFGRHEEKFIEDATNCIRKTFQCTPHAHPTNPSSISINFGGRFLAEFFEKVLKTGRDARTKRVPDLIFNVPDRMKLEFLRGYFRGDGAFSSTKKFKSLRALWAKTSSRELASGILFLLSQLGGFVSIQHLSMHNPGRTYVINISNARTLKMLSETISDLGGNISDINVSKDPFIHRLPASVLAETRELLRVLFRGFLGKVLPPAAWKDKSISYDRIYNLLSRAPVRKTAKVLTSLFDIKGGLTSVELIKKVNSKYNPKIQPESVRSILNHLRRYGFVRIAGMKDRLKVYEVTDKVIAAKRQMDRLQFIRRIIENGVALIPVKKVEKIDSPDFVYDVEVADNRTAVAGLGPVGVGDCDGDPFGFHIAMVVISGSAKLAHINRELAVPDAKFIGVTASDIVDYELPTDKLRELDIMRLKQLLRDPRYGSDFWQREIKKMLELGRKAEQQAFSKYGLDYVVREYLPVKLGLK